VDEFTGVGCHQKDISIYDCNSFESGDSRGGWHSATLDPLRYRLDNVAVTFPDLQTRKVTPMTQSYYYSIELKRSELYERFPTGHCRVMSLDNLEHNTTAGNVCEAPIELAAKLITETTHRLCTSEESKAFDAAQEAARPAATTI
jgi:hypothetical protein